MRRIGFLAAAAAAVVPLLLVGELGVWSSPTWISHLAWDEGGTGVPAEAPSGSWSIPLVVLPVILVASTVLLSLRLRQQYRDREGKE